MNNFFELTEALSNDTHAPVRVDATLRAVVAQVAEDGIDLSCLTYVCTGCGSCGFNASRAVRDRQSTMFDYGCCGPVVVFRTRR